MTSQIAPRVLVLDADMVPGLTIARSLARRGCQVDVASHIDKPIAGYSRAVREQFIYPSPLSMTASFLEWLAAHTQDSAYDLVIPVTERTLVPLSRARNQFEHVKIAMPAAQSLDLVLDKSETLKLAEALDVPIPKGIGINSLEEMHTSLPELTYPVVIKPSRSIGSKDGGASHLQVSYAFEPVGLVANCTHALLFGGVVLQEYFEGSGVGIELIARHGEIIYAFQHRRLHEVPLTGGGSSLRLSEAVNPDLLEASRKLIEALNWNGVAMVEFKLNTETGEFCLMEINGRFWGSLPLANAAGADFPSMLLDLELEDEVRPCTPYKEGVVCRLLSRDLFWYEAVLRAEGDSQIVNIPSRSEVVKELGLFLSLKHRFDVQSVADPVPGLVDLGQIIQTYFRRINTLLQEKRFLSQQNRAWRRGEVAEAVTAADSMLFVCYGNINRSALADVMVRAYAEDTGIKVYSAGFHQDSGRPSDPVMIDIAAQGGMDMSAIRSTSLTDEMIRKSDVIFVMEKRHYDSLLEMRPDAAGRVFLLGAHAGAGDLNPEIADPYGQSRDEYKLCHSRVAGAIDILKALIAMRSAI
jgi:predicted ATP-grasp superfamily ATP-dependent carboligase